ncbi:MAG: SagB/ThcOx family dehydrogenase, partial [Desulfomonile sp.]|nr:SagB/ThcOx family dehydrogenase [Desulfomonile sp.]
AGRIFIVTVAGAVFLLILVAGCHAGDSSPIQLLEPKLDQSKSLASALKERKSSRDFRPDNLSPQTLSNLLWCAFGINRSDSGKRTAPSARNRQEIDIYVVGAEGVYLYDPKAHALMPVASGDIRDLCGVQEFVKDAALNLVYVADPARMSGMDETAQMYYAAADTGFIGQNVYLYCASEGLATVFRALMDKQKLAEALKLRPDQRIMFSQTVGLPKH